MKKEIKEYIETLKALEELGNKIIDKYYNTDDYDDYEETVDEIECMNNHIDISIIILNKTIKGKR